VKFDLVGNRHWFFIVSGALAVLSLIVLAIPPVLRPGIEFTSGTTTLIRFQKPLTEDDLRAEYASLGHAEARIQTTNAGTEFLIRTRELQVPVGSFSEAAPTPAAASTPVGPQPAQALGTLKIG
jgi:preprotein translocase subunit SecF